MIRTGIVGLGYWGRNLARVAFDSDRFTLMGVIDDRSPIENVTVPQYRSLAAAVGALDLEAVMIATPATTHAEIALEALEAGLHVLVEKPLATSSADGERLCKAAAVAERVLMVDHTFLASPRFVAVSQAARLLGPVSRVWSIREHMGGPRDVSAWWDLLPHDLSIMRALVPGWVPHTVGCAGSGEAGLVWFESDTARLEVGLSRVSEDKVRSVAVHCPRGSILWNDLAALPVMANVGDEAEVDLLPCGTAEPLAWLVDDFADAIEGRETSLPVRPSGVSAVWGLRLIEACDVARTSGETVTIH